MAVVKKGKKETKSKVKIAYKCYACGKYDGTFGPESEEHTHVCEICKGLPPDQESIHPIPRHLEQYVKIQAEGGELGLPCPQCELERDECQCANNPFRDVRPVFQ